MFHVKGGVEDFELLSIYGSYFILYFILQTYDFRACILLIFIFTHYLPYKLVLGLRLIKDLLVTLIMQQ